LAITALGNVGQAQTWVANQVALESSLKPELLATARLLVSGVRDVSGPSAAPISLYPDLSAASIEHLERTGQLPRAALVPGELIDAHALLAVGTWAGSKTELSPRALFGGRFTFVGATRSSISREANGCLDFAPQTVSPPMEVRLRLRPGENGASARVVSAAAAPGLTNHVAALLVSPSGRATTSAVQLAVPLAGTGYLSDNDPQAELLLLWDVGTPLELCGLEGGAR
jgi:hypothetical protein